VLRAVGRRPEHVARWLARACGRALARALGSRGGDKVSPQARALEAVPPQALSAGRSAPRCSSAVEFAGAGLRDKISPQAHSQAQASAGVSSVRTASSSYANRRTLLPVKSQTRKGADTTPGAATN